MTMKKLLLMTAVLAIFTVDFAEASGTLPNKPCNSSCRQTRNRAAEAARAAAIAAGQIVPAANPIAAPTNETIIYNGLPQAEPAPAEIPVTP